MFSVSSMLREKASRGCAPTRTRRPAHSQCAATPSNTSLFFKLGYALGVHWVCVGEAVVQSSFGNHRDPLTSSDLNESCRTYDCKSWLSSSFVGFERCLYKLIKRM